MSKVLGHLYVGDIYVGHSLFEHFDDPDICIAPPNIKGVISACFDVPQWCNSYSRCDHQTAALNSLITSPHFDKGYIDLHVDRIVEHRGDAGDSTPSDDGSYIYVLHMVINAEDSCSERLYRAFGFTYDFVEAVHSLEQGNTYIHCMMGMSRSCSLVCAYLMRKYDSSFSTAIQKLKHLHPIASPSTGFICQLILYYKRRFQIHDQEEFWIAYRNLLRIIDLDNLQEYETRLPVDTEDPGSVYSCAKCRQTLFYSHNIIKHQPGARAADDATNPCSSIFVEPMDWMVGMEEQSGKITCKNSRCSSKLGFFCWHGRRCSCGHLQIPAFQIQLSKIDKLPVESCLGGSTPNRNVDLLLQ
ncbi:dual-specificity phosphatase [Babesia ovis]|uniref:protein-tyrosine-phosphatase n=1 Tax=Babesia ovis TaxID=5869 RepID=A0A9W5WTV7_BABOV|nr:dual-specificity phosphatase [Babesia ovis]